MNTIETLPNLRDGLTKKERTLLYCLLETQKELGNRNVPTGMLYGRVCELIDISQEEFQAIMGKFSSLINH